MAEPTSSSDPLKAFENWYSDYHNEACDNYGGIDCTNPKGIAEDAWEACASRLAPQAVAAQAPGNENKALPALRYYRDECTGHEVSQSVFEKMVDEALAAAQAPADPMDWPLPCDVTVGCVTICKGVKLRTLVTRMEVLHKMATTKAEVQAEPVAWLLEGSEVVEFEPQSYHAGDEWTPLYTAPQAQPADALDADGEAFRTAAKLGLTLRFYGGCAQSSKPRTPSAYAEVAGPDPAASMREAVQRVKTTIDAAMAAAQEGGNAATGKGGAA